MKLTYEEAGALKSILVKAQRFDLAVKFRDEEKRLFRALPKKRQQQIINVDTTTPVWQCTPATSKIQLPFDKKLLLPLEKIVKPLMEIKWKQTGNDPHDLYAKPKRSHMLRVERLEKGVYWWAFYIGKDSFASYDVGDYGKSLEDAKEKCELYYYLKITA